MSRSFVALYALPRGRRGGYFRVIGHTESNRLPFRPYWSQALSYEEYLGKIKPETSALCRRLGVDVLFRVLVDRSPRGELLFDALEGKEKVNALDE